MFRRNYIYAPLKILLLFNVVTLLLFVFGPVNWKLENVPLVILYISFCLLTMYTGFYIGIESYKRKSGNALFGQHRKKIYFVIFFTFAWFLPLIYLRLGIDSFSIGSIIDKVSEGFVDPLGVYRDKLLYFENMNSRAYALNAINNLVSPVIVSFFPFSILYFKNFSRSVKVGIVIVFTLELLSWISIGTNKGITDLAIFSFFTAFVVNPKILKVKLRSTVITVTGLCIVLFFFVNSMLSRFGVTSGSGSVLEKLDLLVLGNPTKTTGIYAEMNLGIKFALTQITSYLSQGYYTVGLAFGEPFTWTYGFGNSTVGISLYEKFFNDDLMPRTYMAILEKSQGVPSDTSWYSIYLWLAADFTFIGVPFVFFFIGYVYSKSWLDTIYRRNIYASVMFCLLSQMIFYFFANNQVISFSFIPFVLIFTLWAFNR